MSTAHERARALLLESIFLDDANAERIAALVRPVGLESFRDVPWPLVLALAQRHAVAPALAWSLERHGLLDQVPDDVRAHLVELRVQNAMQNHLLLDDLETVAAGFHRAGIRALVMKGAALIAGGHVPVAARHLDDIDLWLSPRDAARASQLLLDTGFVLRQRGRFTHDGQEHEAGPVDHHLPGIVSPAGTLVELHVRGHTDPVHGSLDALHAVDEANGTSEVGGTRDDHIAFERAWSRALVDDARPALRLPTPANLLDELAVHVVHHHAGFPTYWPRHLVDTACLLRSGARTDRMPEATALSIEVLRGVRDAHAPRTATRAAAKLVLPGPERVLLANARRALGANARLHGPGLTLHALLPARSYLEHHGYLVAGESVVVGHARRWRRVLGLA